MSPDASTADFLPPNWSPLEYALADACARLSSLPIPIAELWSPDDCPPDLLPFLAYALGVDIWDSGWSDQQKRAVIRNSFWLRRHRGTRGALTAPGERDDNGNLIKAGLFAMLGISAVVKEWWEQEPNGVPYTFAVTIAVAPRPVLFETADGALLMTAEGYYLFTGEYVEGEDALDPGTVDAINKVKPVRSEMFIGAVDSHGGTLNMVGYITAGTFERITFSGSLPPHA